MPYHSQDNIVHGHGDSQYELVRLMYGRLVVGQLDAITSLCSLKACPTRLGAWPIDAGRVAVYSAQPSPLLGHCQDGRRLNVEHSGYGLISVTEGSEVVFGDLLLRGGHQDSSKTVVTISQDVEAWQDLLPDTNATKIKIRWPQPVSSVLKTVNEQLSAGETVLSAWTVLAIGMAAAAVITTVLFLIYFYCKFRAAAAAMPHCQLNERNSDISAQETV